MLPLGKVNLECLPPESTSDRLLLIVHNKAVYLKNWGGGGGGGGLPPASPPNVDHDVSGAALYCMY